MNGTIGLTTTFAQRPQGVTADFWYPSMRRAHPAAAARRAPKTSPHYFAGHEVQPGMSQ